MFQYEYEMPSLTTDIVVFRRLPTNNQALTIERGSEPFKGRYAWPGGFANKNERLIDCAVRELQEETGLVINKKEFKTVGVFDAPGRDPRGWVVTFAFCVFVPADIVVVAGDDAKNYKWRDISDIFVKKDLAFDHLEILRAAYSFIELGAT